MTLFTTASSAPFLLILLAVFTGGAWPLVAVLYISLLVLVLDHIVAKHLKNANPEAEFPGSDTLLIAIAVLHFITLGAAVWAVAGPSGLSVMNRLLIAWGAGLAIGQISHPAAHELVHRSSRHLHMLGKIVYSSFLLGHHASAHIRVHHVHVGSQDDPNSARKGEGFWQYLRQAWPDSFQAGLAAENKLRQGKAPAWRHPYVLYIGVAAGLSLLAALSFGIMGLVGLWGICCHAQIQVFLSDYVQHYGLRRKILPNGRLEPVGPQHSWNAPYWFSSAMMLNAPRHSDHHVTPSRPYPALQITPETMPSLPYPLAVMAVIALYPKLWRRVMDPYCMQWQDGGPAPSRQSAGDLAPAE